MKSVANVMQKLWTNETHMLQLWLEMRRGLKSFNSTRLHYGADSLNAELLDLHANKKYLVVIKEIREISEGRGA